MDCHDLATRPGDHKTVYYSIGVDYTRHRRADPRIEALITTAIGPALSIVNVGAGAGSYEPSDRCVLAVEPSLEMISQRPPGSAPCIQGAAESLPVHDDAFDSAMALRTVHHWNEPAVGLVELGRVADSVVLFTFDPANHNSLSLFQDYVPAITRLRSGVEAMPIEAVACCSARTGS